jgi:predicted site-specific integrase-resolvase
METYDHHAGVAVGEWIEEVSGGVNFRRKKVLEIVDRMQHGEIERLVGAHKDRLVRFGFDLISHIVKEVGCEIVVVNKPSCFPG